MAKRLRSPAYPGLTLTDSLQRMKAFYQKENKHAAPISAALNHWGYSEKSGNGKIAVAALKAYGLLDDQGSGNQRLVKLTETALDIIRDEREVSPSRDALLDHCARQPKLIAGLLEEYPEGLPSPATLRHYLLRKEYNPNSVTSIIKVIEDAYRYINPVIVGDSGDSEEVVDVPEAYDAPLAPAPATVRPSPSRAAPIAGHEIANIRVAKDCAIRLIADGPYSEKSIRSLVAQLELGLQLGTYSDD